MNILKICSKVIEFSFYTLFFLVPLAFTDKTSELFEFNKMWVTFGFTIIIAAAWFIKMILQKRILLCRTPLDIPIVLFLLSQFISTIFSLDTHTSIWGYYSRFNGGLLSIVSYILLYYAFLSNLSHLSNLIVKRLLLISLMSGAVVALWGLPSHFGYDPTCLLFRGNFDVSCWTDAFQPKIRIFSTLGQPNWMAAYLSILIPLSIAFTLSIFSSQFNPQQKNQKSIPIKSGSKINPDQIGIKNQKFFILSICYLIFTILFFIDLLYTRSNSGFLGLMGGLLLFLTIILLNSVKSIFNKIFVSSCSLLIFSSWILLKWKDIKIVSIFSTVFVTLFLSYFIYTSIKSKDSILYKFRSFLFLSFGALIIISLFIGTPMTPKIGELLPKLTSTPAKTVEQPKKDSQPQGPALEVGGTDSGKIRLIVWKGAIDIFKNNPLFGSGVETFAFAYYKYRPPSHNLTSEWDYLYNKAHNEYLNYLATTGAFGLGTYLLMITWFFWIIFKQFKIQNSKLKITIQNSKLEKKKLLTDNYNFELCTLNFALVASYVSILVSNFFGFSVVIVNLYFFLIPAFVFILSQAINPEKALSFPKVNIGRHPEFISGSKIPKQVLPAGRQVRNDKKYATIENKTSGVQLIAISFIILTSSYLIFTLFRFFSADTDYALGSNYNKIGEYEIAHAKLVKAVQKRGSEPTFKDELSSNKSALSLVAINNKDATSAADLIKDALELSDKNTTQHPNNIIFWKTRVRIFYTLGQFDSSYLRSALDSIIKAAELAPTDAKISYNLGVLYGQTGNNEKAIETLKDTIKLKPDYRDAYYAMGLFYHEAAIDKEEKVIKPDMQKKAVETMNYILTSFSKDDKQAKEALEKWGVL